SAPQSRYLEVVFMTTRRNDELPLEIDRHRRHSSARLEFGRDFFYGRAVKHDRQHAVLEAVAVEDFAEARSQNRPQAHLHHRPNGSLARGTAAEVCTGEQDFGIAIRSPIENKIRI